MPRDTSPSLFKEGVETRIEGNPYEHCATVALRYLEKNPDRARESIGAALTVELGKDHFAALLERIDTEKKLLLNAEEKKALNTAIARVKAFAPHDSEQIRNAASIIQNREANELEREPVKLLRRGLFVQAAAGAAVISGLGSAMHGLQKKAKILEEEKKAPLEDNDKSQVAQAERVRREREKDSANEWMEGGIIVSSVGAVTAVVNGWSVMREQHKKIQGQEWENGALERYSHRQSIGRQMVRDDANVAEALFSLIDRSVVLETPRHVSRPAYIGR